MYSEITPSGNINPFVQSFWKIEPDEKNTSDNKDVLPDGCFDIVVYIYKNKENQVFLTGIWEKPIKVSTPSDTKVVGIRFYPCAIDIILNMKLAELKNISIPLPADNIKQPKNLTLNLLYTSKDELEIIDFMTLYLTLLISSDNNQPNKILDTILNSSPKYSINDIATHIGISERHLTRKLNEFFGIRTKTYLSILRFIKAKKLLISNTQTPLSHIAIDAGYYDQAHFIKEFKKFSGKTPKQFLLEHV